VQLVDQPEGILVGRRHNAIAELLDVMFATLLIHDVQLVSTSYQ
jgi:hypothetical protein